MSRSEPFGAILSCSDPFERMRALVVVVSELYHRTLRVLRLEMSRNPFISCFRATFVVDLLGRSCDADLTKIPYRLPESKTTFAYLVWASELVSLV
jgi:hypothetical protein